MRWLPGLARTVYSLITCHSLAFKAQPRDVIFRKGHMKATWALCQDENSKSWIHRLHDNRTYRCTGQVSSALSLSLMQFTVFAEDVTRKRLVKRGAATVAGRWPCLQPHRAPSVKPRDPAFRILPWVKHCLLCEMSLWKQGFFFSPQMTFYFGCQETQSHTGRLAPASWPSLWSKTAALVFH